MIMAHPRATNEVKAFLPAVAHEVSAALGADYGQLAGTGFCWDGRRRSGRGRGPRERVG